MALARMHMLILVSERAKNQALVNPFVWRNMCRVLATMLPPTSVCCCNGEGVKRLNAHIFLGLVEEESALGKLFLICTFANLSSNLGAT